MSAVPGYPEFQGASPARDGPAGPRPIADGDEARPLAFDAAGVVPLSRFLAQVRGVAAALPEARQTIDLCEDRYRFLVMLCAAAVRGQATLLPPSRAAEVVA